MNIRSTDDLAGPPGHSVHRSKKTTFGLPRWLIITAGILLGLGIAFLAIAFPILKTTVWKNKLGNDGTGVGGPGDSGSGGSGSKVNAQRWVDPDTPKEMLTRKMEDGSEYKLIFSDEFNQDGRDFRPGKDDRWEAVDLHNWQTGDLEYYHPDQAITKDGQLRIIVDRKPMKGQNYVSAMLQSWNKFCFRGGYIEARVSLPGSPTIPALWPAVWTMGNLARAGYGGSTDGLWPYSYDSCDLGVQPRQGLTASYSKLIGQRLNKCLCSDQDTPSPGVGRGAPEIDLIEGAAADGGNNGGGTVSQSHQFAPFDVDYKIVASEFVIHNASSTYKNGYTGAELQQMVSAKTKLPSNVYEGKDYLDYAFEYEPGNSGHVNWFVGNQKRASLTAKAVGPNAGNGVSQRPISEEPMSIILNVAMSSGFGEVHDTKVTYPATMFVDHIRIYQHPDRIDFGCDPKDRPTAQYIKDHIKLYTDPTIKAFNVSGYPLPEYRVPAQCSA